MRRVGGIRRAAGAVLAALAGASLLVSCSSDPAPTGVTIAWAEGERAVQVNWKDSGQPNRISIEGVVSASPSYVKYLGKDEPNTWAIPVSAFPPDGNYRIAVATGTSTGGVTSKPARSPMFDTDGPARPGAATAVPAGRAILVRWSVGAPPQDFSPNDPLDVKSGVQQYLPVVGRAGQPLRNAPPATTSTRRVLKGLEPPFQFQLRATNEWSTRIGAHVQARTSSIDAGFPALAQYSLPVRVRGRVLLQETSCPPESRCVQQRTTMAKLPVEVQTQVTPGARWTPAARGVTTAGGHFDVTMVTGPSRPYRVTVPLYATAGLLVAPSVSKPKLTTSVVRISAAGILGGVASKKSGESVTVYATVKPAMNATVMFQAWNRTTRQWTNVRPAAMRGGLTGYTFAAPKPGGYLYRFVIPASRLAGRTILGGITPPVNLHVRP